MDAEGIFTPAPSGVKRTIDQAFLSTPTASVPVQTESIVHEPQTEHNVEKPMPAQTSSESSVKSSNTTPRQASPAPTSMSSLSSVTATPPPPNPFVPSTLMPQPSKRRKITPSEKMEREREKAEKRAKRDEEKAKKAEEKQVKDEERRQKNEEREEKRREKELEKQRKKEKKRQEEEAKQKKERVMGRSCPFLRPRLTTSAGPETNDQFPRQTSG